MAESIAYSREIPVRHNVDVFVGGGGPAGIAAALVAARQGARVFLAESCGCLGGMGTMGLVPAFMMFGDGVHFLAEGIGREVLNALTAEKGPGYPASEMSIPCEMLKRVYDRLLVKAGVNFAFHTNIVDVICQGNKISSVICNAKSGFFAVKAKVYIDGTGDGDLSVWAGAPFEKGDENGDMMPGTLCSLWCDVEFDKYLEAKRQGYNRQEVLKSLFGTGYFTVDDPHHPGMWRTSKHVTGGNIGHAFGVDATDERSLTHFLIEGRERILELQKFYKEYVPGYENLDLVATANVMGIRESRRIMGDYILGEADFRERAVFEDEIGRYCYPVDIHPSRPNATEYAAFEKEYFSTLRYKAGESYGIPYRCLLPKNVDNLLVAGRCLSCDRKMQGSIRVMPGCYITGQAVGMAASIAVKLNTTPRDIPVKQLQKQLVEMGAYLPNM